MNKTKIHKNFLWYIAFFLTVQIVSQSQEEILRDLRDDTNSYQDKNVSAKDNHLEELKTIHLKVTSALDTKEDKLAIKEANEMEKLGITPNRLKITQSAELSEGQILYLKIRRLRAEAFYNLRAFRNALPDSKFILENHPRPVIFDYTRYAVSLYYVGEEKKAKRILDQAQEKFKNENDQAILRKTNQLLFPDY